MQKLQCLALAVFLVQGSAAAQVRWTPLADLPRQPMAPVFDTVRGRVIAFAAHGEPYEQLRPFEWNGRWQTHGQTADSGLVAVTAAVFDRTRGEALLVGQAFGSPNRINVTYRSGRFRTIPGVPVPSGAAYVDDPARGEVLAFGGEGPQTTVLDGMWRWNGAAWSAVSQPALRPAPRQNAALVFDPLRARVVLFGGSDWFRNPAGDTWTWDGQTWQQVATAGPLPRERAGFAFDPATGTCLLHGGMAGNQEVADTWQWDGAIWTQVNVTASPGSGALIETADRPLLLREVMPANNGTFRWNGAGFVQLAPPQNALPNWEARLVYDSARGQLAIFGGQPVTAGLWLWNGSWSHLPLTTTGPAGRRLHSMVFDAVRQQIVLFGGRADGGGGVQLGDTWTWNGTIWSRHFPSLSPVSREAAGFSCDAARGTCLLFGGFAFGPGHLGDTWLWDGSNWTQAQPGTQPPLRRDPGMAYDEARQRIVMLNGMSAQGGVTDQWEWDGSNWLLQNPLVQPGGAIAYDRQRGRVIVVTFFGAIHSWDGAQWHPVPVNSPPGQRPVPLSIAWHDGLGRMVLYTQGGYDRTLWALTPTPPLVEPFGAPCPASSTNDCDLLALGRPRLGNDRFELDLRGRAANVYGAVAWGFAPSSTPIGGGCVLLVDVVTSQLVFLGNAGYCTVRAPIPNVTSFLGLEIRLQGFALDGTGPIGGVSASAGLRLLLGR